ncbi:MAG: hypothetical protein EOO08_14220 [Chitinophagaceae bacterium]|nr:MAG: hypothetical protein EOO08_14220 [Chitinophagaceae bacterium]
MIDCTNHSNIFFIQEHLVRGALFHGGIGNQDAEQVMLDAGYRPLRLGDEYNFSPLAKLRRYRAARKVLAGLPKGATVVFQWPLYARLHRMLIEQLVRRRPDVEIICFLTDLNSIKDGDAKALADEKRFFAPLHSFIAHNEAMCRQFMKDRENARCTTIEFFDFLTPPVPAQRSLSPALCFAGALDKSGFLARCSEFPALHFHLYGPGRERFAELANSTYHGIFSPHSLPPELSGSFGLVWDGDSPNALEGMLGNYSKFISPHKLSLYILAGLPIICHEESAAAELVLRYGIGFTVRGLGEIGEKIARIDDAGYRQMRTKQEPLAARISTGACLRSALAALRG